MVLTNPSGGVLLQLSGASGLRRLSANRAVQRGGKSADSAVDVNSPLFYMFLAHLCLIAILDLTFAQPDS